MLKTVSRNSFLYRNTNNVGVVYEFLGNNAFSNEDLVEFCDFIQQNDLMSEFIVMNHKGVKTYYVTFYIGEIGYANNYNTYNAKTFYDNYNKMMNLKPKIEELKIFEGEKNVDRYLKLYHLEKTSVSEYRKQYLKRLKYRRNDVRNHILKESFSSYVRKLINNTDYQKYIFNKDFHANANYEFHPIDQEIFESSLKFMIGNQFFIFPLYIKGITQKSGDLSYQELSIGEITTNFLDNHIATEKEKGKDIVSYEYKVSIRPVRDVHMDKEARQVSIGGDSTKFDVESIRDNSNMAFEYQHSMFLYTKRPDMQKFLMDFKAKFGTKLELIQADVPKDFNMQYLSHNKFSDAYHVGHIRNLHTLVGGLKEYFPVRDDGMWLGREFFSNNDFQFNYFDIAGKEPETGNLIANANGMIAGTTGAGKTYIAENRLFYNNYKDQIIVFDNMGNFAKTFRKKSEEEQIRTGVGLLEYGPDFPNIVGKINKRNITSKQDIFYTLIIGARSELSSEVKEMIKANINKYMENNIGGFFKLSLFREYIFNKSVDEVFSKSDRAIILNKIDAFNNTLKNILNNDTDFSATVFKYQKVILSYQQMLSGGDDDTRYFMLGVLLDLVKNYIEFKGGIDMSKLTHPYTMVLYDEAHQVVNKSKKLDMTFSQFVRQNRNYRANTIIITQFITDMPDTIRNMCSFFILLDPINWGYYKSELYGPEATDSNKTKLIVDNLEGPIQMIEDKFTQDMKDFQADKLPAKDVTRFCVFTFKPAKMFFLINTKQ